MKREKIRLLAFPLISLLLFISVVFLNRQLIFGNSHSVIYTYLDSFAKGEIGSGYGQAEVQYIPFDKLEPGDILLGGWPNCAYGRYSHAGLYLGNNEVLEAYVDYGVCIQPLNHYVDYTELCFLRVKSSPAVKNEVIKTARSYAGKMFYPLAFKSGGRYWNCSKIIWKAYADEGIDLDINRDLWVAPESFKNAPAVQILYEREM